MKHERTIVSIKQDHRRALKDISEALEQKLYSSKDISEAHRVFYEILIHVWLSQKVCTARMIVEYLETKTQIIQDAPSKTHIMWRIKI